MGHRAFKRFLSPSKVTFPRGAVRWNANRTCGSTLQVPLQGSRAQSNSEHLRANHPCGSTGYSLRIKLREFERQRGLKQSRQLQKGDGNFCLSSFFDRDLPFNFPTNFSDFHCAQIPLLQIPMLSLASSAKAVTSLVIAFAIIASCSMLLPPTFDDDFILFSIKTI